MKIDSPTFLTETTFVSASVQFSSGSQKFGDTTDDLHQFTGSMSITGDMGNKISGSSSSTGSFGQVATNTIAPQGSSLTVKEYISLHPSTTNGSIGISAVGAGSGDYYVDYYNYQGGDAYIKLRTASSGTGRPYIQLGNQSGQEYYTMAVGNGANAYNFQFVSGSNDNYNDSSKVIFEVLQNVGDGARFRSGRDVRFGGDVAFLNSSAGYGFVIEDGTNTISGSATSTGSFGSVQVQGSPLITGDSDSVIIGNYSKGNTNLLIRSNGSSATTGIRIERGSSGNNFLLTNDGSFNLERDGVGDLMKVSYTGTFQFPQANTKISGSSTSTGSFGSLVVADAIQGDTTIKGGQLFFDNNEGPRTNSENLTLTTTRNVNLNDYGSGNMFTADGTHEIIYLGTSTKNMTTRVYGNLRLDYGDFDITGSATSTGSFGDGHIAGKLGIGTTSHLSTRKLTVSDGNVQIDAGRFYYVTTAGYGLSYSSNQALITGYNGLKVQAWDSGLTDIFSVTKTKISGSATSTGSFGHLMTFDSGNGASGDTLSQVHSSYQKRPNHARFYPMIMRDLISGTGFIPIELTQTYGSGIYHVIHGEIEIMVSQVLNPLRIHFKAVHSANNWYRTNVDVISKDGDSSIIPIYFANKDDKGYMLIGNAEFSRWASGTIFIDYLAKTNYDSNFDEMLSVDFSSTVQTNFSDYTINKTHDENYYPTLGRRTAGTTSTGWHSIGKFTGTQDTGYAKVRISRGSVATAIFEVDGAYNYFNGKLLATNGYINFDSYFTGFRVHDSGSAPYLQVNMVGNQSGNAVVQLLETNGSFKLLPFEPTGSAGGGSTRIEVPLSRHEPFTIANQDLVLQGGDTADGNVSGSATSTGSFGMLRVGDGGGNLELRAKSANIAIGNLNTYPDFRDTSGGNYNVAVGAEVFMDLTSGERNTGVGYQAGRHNVGGDYNSFFGWEAGMGTSGGTHTGNTALGYQTLFSLNTGANNVAVGRHALYQLDKGSDSVGIGKDAGFYATGSQNTFVGSNAGKGGTTSAPFSSGQNNVAIGYQALTGFTTGTDNVAIGNNAGYALTSGGYHVLIGSGAGQSMTTNTLGSVAVGYRALFSQTVKGRSVAIGVQSLYSLDRTGQDDYNVAIGYRSGYVTTTGVFNVFIGGFAGQQHIGQDSVMIGYQAGQYATGSHNTFVGQGAGQGGTTSAPYSSGENNTAIGANALIAFTTGYDNVMLGHEAGDALTTGYQNVAVGKGALGAANDGHSNTAIGHLAMGNSATNAGNNNIAIGYRTMEDVNDGFANTYVGGLAGGSGGFVSGDYNVGIGYQADKTRKGGDYNISIGYRTNEYQGAGNGQSSIAIGREASKHYGRIAASTYKQMGSRIAIGSYAGAYMTSGDYTTIVGNDSYKGVSGIYNATASYVTTLGARTGLYATGSYNTFVGAWAARGGQTSAPYSSGEYNVAVGVYALQNFTTGDRNIAVGPTALGNVSTGYRNIGIGDRAAVGTTTGHSGVYIGYLAGYGGNQSINVAIGAEALYTANGGSNVAIGYESAKLTTSNDGVWIGANAGKDGAGGGQSVIVGHYAGQYIVGSQVTHLGREAGRYATGSYNTFVGVSAGKGGTTSAPFSSGENNVALGYQALTAFTTGYNNTILGYRAGYSTTTGYTNVYLGYQAGFRGTTARENVAIGPNSQQGVSGQTTGRYNVSLGVNSLFGITTGNHNFAVGSNAGYSLTTGEHNVIIGSAAGDALTTTSNAIMIGRDAGTNINSADANGTVLIGTYAGRALTDGQYNTMIGNLAGKEITTKNRNTIIGYEAVYSSSANDDLVVVGYKAGYNLNGDDHTGAVLIGSEAGYNLTNDHPAQQGSMYIGYQAGYNFTTANTSMGIGFKALYGLYVGANGNSHSNGYGTNLAVGDYSGYYGGNTTGFGGSTYLGHNAGREHVGGRSLYVGYDAGRFAGSGSHNVALGYQAMRGSYYSDDSSLNNEGATVAIGAYALQNMPDVGGSLYSVAIGYQALSNQSGSSGGRNVAVGFAAMNGTHDYGQYNTAVGYGAGGWSAIDIGSTVAVGGFETAGNITAGLGTFIGAQYCGNRSGASGNVAVGYESARYIKGAYVAIGTQALRGVADYSPASNNVAIGYQSGVFVNSGSYNTMVGQLSGQQVRDGDENSFFGYHAGRYATGSNNVFMGHKAGYGASSAPYSSGNSNVGIGHDALMDFTTGGGNTALGNAAGANLTTGGHNVAIGWNALVAGTTAQNNVVVGSAAADAFNGNQNVIIGQNAMTNATSTLNSVIVGFAAGNAMTTGNPNTLIGAYTNVHSGTADHVICLGYGVTGTANHRVHIGNDTSHIYNDYNSNATWTHSSDKRQKKNIEDDNLGLDFINDIRPVTFEHKSPSEFPKEWDGYDADDKEPMGGGGKIHGLIAQEVKEALDKQGIDTFGGWDETPDGRQHVSFEAFVLPLINSVKELTEKNERLENKIKDLEIFIIDKLGEK